MPKNRLRTMRSARTILSNSCWEGMLYRIGQYETAATTPRSVHGCISPSLPPVVLATSLYPQLLLSMAKWQLGEKDEARRLLAEIRPAIDEAIRLPSLRGITGRRLKCLRREAEALIEHDQADVAPKNDNPTPVTSTTT